MILSSAAHPLIGIDPGIRFGRPCIAGTRISVRDVLGLVGNGMSAAEIMDDFPGLATETIAAAQTYAADCLPYYHSQQEADFRVAYQLYTEAEGGRGKPAYQHIRWDLRYADEAVSKATWMMVYPEFLDPDGQMIPNGPFSPIGKAELFVFSEAQRDFHRQHIWPGTRGYFMEGSRRVGVWEVSEVLGLRQPAASTAP